MDEGTLDLRSAHQHGIHAENQPAKGCKDLDEFVACFNPKNCFKRKPSCSPEKQDDQWQKYTYDELVTHEKAKFDIF